MENIVLEEITDKYDGKYIAVEKPTGNKEVISFGDDPAKVLEEALKKYDKPILIYIPECDNFLYHNR